MPAPHFMPVDANDNVITGGSSSSGSPAFTQIQDGASARLATVTAANAVKTDGSAATQPVSGTVTANAGTGTMLVNGSNVTQPVSGTFWPPTQPVSGTFWQATQPVSGTVTTNAGTGTMQVTTSGTTTLTVAAGTGGNTVVKASAGRLCRVLVTSTAGAAATTFYDNASTASGTVIGIFPAAVAVGTVGDFEMPAANGITLLGAATNPAMTISFT